MLFQFGYDLFGIGGGASPAERSLLQSSAMLVIIFLVSTVVCFLMSVMFIASAKDVTYGLGGILLLTLSSFGAYTARLSWKSWKDSREFISSFEKNWRI